MHSLSVGEYSELLAKHKENIESYFRYNLEWNTLYRYLLTPFSPYSDFYAQVQVEAFVWSEDGRLFEKEKTDRRFEYQNEFTATCRIRFSDEQHINQTTTLDRTFKLGCKYYFDDNPHSLNRIEILDSQRHLLSAMNDAVFDFYEKVGIAGDDFKIGTDPLSSRFQQALFQCTPPISIVPFDVWFELLYCLQRFRFSLANMALYKPYLDNPIWHGHYFHDRFVYPSYNTLYDERYFIYCEFTYQSLYHFWDRVGDILAEAVVTKLSPTAIDFVRVIDRLENSHAYDHNSAFQWLNNFKTTDYKLLNEERKRTVHYETVTTKMKRQHLDAVSNLPDIQVRQDWIEGRVDYFVEQFHQAVEGMRQLTLFLETK